MPLEPPIVEVINILTHVQENCPQSVCAAIEKALLILRSPDLYTPPLPSSLMPAAPKRQESDADEITSDLFTGLIHSNKPVSGVRRMSYEAAVANRQSFSSLRDFTSPLAANPPSTCRPSLVPSTSCPLPSATNIPDNIKQILDSQLDWTFDIIRLEQITVRQPLVWLGLSILSHFNVCATLNCEEATLRSWLSLIESNYRDNPYHNSTHAADVLQATAYFLTKPRLEAIFDPLDQAIALIAAICHDIDHPGKSSAFLCNSGSELAILYNDISVLESHHAALTFKLTLTDPTVNIFKNLDQETFKEVRHSIIDMILATEMTKHFEHLTKFVNVFTKSLSVDGETAASVSSGGAGDAKSGTRDAKAGKSGAGGAAAAASSSLSRIRSSSLASPENVVLVKRILIKCADVSNPTRPLHLCVAWGHRIAEEYCNQTDEEKANGMPVVMPVFDRSTCSIPKSQVRTRAPFFSAYRMMRQEMRKNRTAANSPVFFAPAVYL
jgi:high affinity cAMP-specific and IBMX-insensitive 3',5'-cyclic phosphodiesterase 8